MARKAKAKPVEDQEPGIEDVTGPSPNPYTNLLLADLALRAGTGLARRMVERGFLGGKYTSAKAKHIVKGRSMTGALVSTAVARIATRSVPGAILVGGGLLAKTLYDRKKGAAARRAGEAKLDELAEKGADSGKERIEP